MGSSIGLELAGLQLHQRPEATDQHCTLRLRLRSGLEHARVVPLIPSSPSSDALSMQDAGHPRHLPL